MNGRERLNTILHRKKADRLSWTALVDDATLNALPEPWRGIGPIEFYRRLECDIFLLNGWNTPHTFQSPRLKWGDNVTEGRRQEEGRTILEWKTARGSLTAIYDRGHPVKYAVETEEDLRIYREMWEGAAFVSEDDRASFQAINQLIGGDGITTRFWGPSCIPRLLENDVGTVNFYYLMNDHPAEMKAVIELMHQRELGAFEILAQHPCEVVTLCENTSTYYISPDIYRRYNGPHQRDFVEIMHRHGKIALLHMCGHVKDLLADIKQTGMDGVHALTPPPTGNTPWEMALDAWGDDTVILAALDPSVFIMEPVEDIAPALDAFYTPRLRRAPFVLGAFADGVQVPLERFQAVAKWFSKQAGAGAR
jgi:hypothetical protein